MDRWSSGQGEIRVCGLQATVTRPTLAGNVSIPEGPEMLVDDGRESLARRKDAMG